LALVAGRQDTRFVLVGRGQSTLDATAALLPGHPIDIFQLDVTDSLGRERLAAFLDAKYGRVDVLMNNAGRILVWAPWVIWKRQTSRPCWKPILPGRFC
jgi:NADP-dependent 3-hydroxy acid dehydrogenase YdfG